MAAGGRLPGGEDLGDGFRVLVGGKFLVFFVERPRVGAAVARAAAVGLGGGVHFVVDGAVPRAVGCAAGA